MCECVCVIKGVTEVTDFATKTAGPRSAGVQAAFVRAMCGGLCAALQWIRGGGVRRRVGG